MEDLVKEFFNANPEIAKEYNKFVYEKTKNELDKAADEYERNPKSFNCDHRIDFKEGVKWLIERWNRIKVAEFPTAIISNFDYFIEKECKC